MAITAPLDHEVGLGPAEAISPHELAARLAEGRSGVTVLDLATVAGTAGTHRWIPGSLVARRATLTAAPDTIPGAAIVVTSHDGLDARRAAAELAAVTSRPVRALEGGTTAWVAAGLLTTEGTFRQELTPGGVVNPSGRRPPARPPR